jgi:hypothetical protein
MLPSTSSGSVPVIELVETMLDGKSATFARIQGDGVHH